MKKLCLFLAFVISYQGFSQDTRLLENTWYLHDLVINGMSNIPPFNNEIPFIAADFFQNGDFLSSVCDEHGAGLLEYFGTAEFDVLDYVVLTGGCNDPDNQSYAGLYHGFWWYLEDNGIVTYEIIEDGQNLTLIITAANDDRAIYGNDLLSLPTHYLPESKFSISPTLVKTSFNIIANYNNVISKVNIYNLFGQNVLTLTNQKYEIDVSDLAAGIYLVSIQDNKGNITIKRILKL